MTIGPGSSQHSIRKCVEVLKTSSLSRLRDLVTLTRFCRYNNIDLCHIVVINVLGDFDKPEIGIKDFAKYC